MLIKKSAFYGAAGHAGNNLLLEENTNYTIIGV